MTEVMNIANEYGLKVVEDAAEGFMSEWDGRPLGTLGIAGCLSFSPNKTITTGQGGMVLTNDDALYIRLRELKDHGRPTRGTGGDDAHHSVGYNFKFTNLQAAVGLAQLTALETRLERQKQIYRIYASELCELPGIRLPGFRLETGEIPQWTDAVIERRDELDQYLMAKDIHCRRFWHAIHTQVPYRQPDDAFQNSTLLMPKAIWLPSAFTLSDDDILTVCKVIKGFITRG
jgi:perosamine synthetase